MVQMHTEAINHEPAITFIQTGSMVAGKPCFGAWMAYGLGSMNQDLPAFVVLNATHSHPKAGVQAISAKLWSAGFLSAKYAGVALRSKGDPVLYVTAARIFWYDRKLEKADGWFQKAAILDPDLGDTWAWWYKFLVQHGTEEKREGVVAKCVLNEPRHGEVWQRVRKAPENAGLSVEEVLKRVAALLE